MTCGWRLSNRDRYTGVTQIFNVNVLVRHGRALSFILFNLVPDFITKKLDIRGIFHLCLTQNVLSKHLFIIAVFPFNLLARISAKNFLRKQFGLAPRPLPWSITDGSLIDVSQNLGGRTFTEGLSSDRLQPRLRLGQIPPHDKHCQNVTTLKPYRSQCTNLFHTTCNCYCLKH